MPIPLSDYPPILANLPKDGVGDEGFEISDEDEAILTSIVERNEVPSMTKEEIEMFYAGSISG